MANFTERAISQSLLELLQEHPIDKITVKDITDYCGISRNTFYYHYHDVYEVLENYFIAQTEGLILKYEENNDWEGGFLEGLELLYENKKMINNVYKAIDREELRRFLDEFSYRHSEIVIRKEIEGRGYAEKTIALVTDFYKNAILGAVIAWIEGGMNEKPKKLALIYSALFEGTIEAAFDSAKNIL